MADILDALDSPQVQQPKDLLDAIPTQQAGQVSQADQLPGVMPRGTSLTDVIGNTFWDAVDMGAGLAQIGTMPFVRLGEAATYPELGMIRTMDQTLIDSQGNQKTFPSDITSVQQFAKLAVDDWMNNYGKPAMEGRFQDIGKRFVQHPLFSYYDTVGMVGGGNIARAAAKSNVAKSLPLVGGAIAKQEAKTALETAFKEGVLADIQKLDGAAKDAWDKIPGNLRKDVGLYAEGRHPDLLAGKPMPEQIANYLEAVKPVADDMTDLYSQMRTDARVAQMVEKGAISKATPEIIDQVKKEVAANVDFDRHAPFIMQKYGFASINDIPQAARSRLIQEAKKELSDLGISADYYSPWVLASEAERIMANPFALAKQSSKSLSKAKGSAGTAKFTNHFDALKTRTIQLAQHHNYYDKILREAIDLGKEVAGDAVQAGNKAVNFRDQFKHIAKAAMPTFSEAELRSAMKAIPEGMFEIPAAMAEALERVLPDPGLSSKLWGHWMSYTKRYLLAGSPFFPEIQGVQQFAQLGMIALGGVKNSLTAAAGFLLAMNPKIRKLFPAHITEPPGAITEILGNNQGLFKNVPIVKGIEKAIDFQYYRLGLYDHAARTTAAIQQALLLSLADKQAGSIFKRMFNIGNELKRITSDPKKLLIIDRHVKDILGDFQSPASPLMKKLKATFMWAGWWREFFRFMGKAEKDAPIVLGGINRATQILPNMYGDKEAPEWAQKQGAIRLFGLYDANGMPYYLMRSSLSPLTTLSEIAAFFTTPFDSGGDSTVFTSLHPLLGLPLTIFSRTNLSTGRPYSDPRLVRDGGDQFAPENVFNQDEPLKAIRPLPNLVELIARQTFGHPIRVGETIFEAKASGGQRSQFTSLLGLESVPKQDSFGEVRKTNQTDLAAQILNLPIISLDIEREQEFKAYEPIRRQKLMKKAFRKGKTEESKSTEGKIDLLDLL